MSWLLRNWFLWPWWILRGAINQGWSGPLAGPTLFPNGAPSHRLELVGATCSLQFIFWGQWARASLWEPSFPQIPISALSLHRTVCRPLVESPPVHLSIFTLPTQSIIHGHLFRLRPLQPRLMQNSKRFFCFLPNGTNQLSNLFNLASAQTSTCIANQNILYC